MRRAGAEYGHLLPLRLPLPIESSPPDGARFMESV